MPRLISFIVLVAVVLLVTALFFRVMLEFLVPMFLAAVLVVVFQPLHRWYQVKLPGHPHWAAGATTVSIVLIVLLPAVLIAWNAYVEVATIAAQAFDGTNEETSELEQKIDAAIAAVTTPLRERYKIHTPEPAKLRQSFFDTIRSWADERGGTAAIVGVQWLVRTLVRIVVGLVIMTITIYYFLADGPAMLVTIMRLSPLDDRYELELLEKFSNISRAVVLATLLSAFVQGVLAGIGYYFAGIPAVFALTGLTMLLAVVPFLGAASVWIPTAAWLFFAEGRVAAATALAIYGAAIVSTIDNVIKPYVLHGQSNLHPLLALLSVLGGVAALGPIGILVGPMAVAFLQALLGMLRREILEMGESGKDSTASAALDETTGQIDAGSDLPAPSPATPRPEPDKLRHEQQSATTVSPRRKGKGGRASKRRQRS